MPGEDIEPAGEPDAELSVVGQGGAVVVRERPPQQVLPAVLRPAGPEAVEERRQQTRVAAAAALVEPGDEPCRLPADVQKKSSFPKRPRAVIVPCADMGARELVSCSA